ncbi:MAG: fibronectin type III domain-containing protein [Gemmatimonadetes bacterium]|nr:fibronectin type III domain-containing protein [Gemmatimonadota bacterium]
MKKDLRYAELETRGKRGKLKQLGWSAPREKAALEPPGEVRDIAIRAEGDTWLVLDWNPPGDGGAPAAYKVQRKKPDSAWELVATSMELETLVSGQPRGLEMQFRVVAANKAGEGQPSGVVNVVL